MHTRSVAAFVSEIVVSERERRDGVEAAGGRWNESTQANARANGSIAVKPQAWMRCMLTVSGLVNGLGRSRSRSVAGCGSREKKSALPIDEANMEGEVECYDMGRYA